MGEGVHRGDSEVSARVEETLAERSKSYGYVRPFTFDLGPRGTQQQGLEVTEGGSDLGLNSGLDTQGSYFI